MKVIKFLGYSITLGKGSGKTAEVLPPGKKRASQAVKAMPKRNLSYEIEHINMAIQRAENIDSPERGMLIDIFKYIMKDGHLSSQLRLAKLKVKSEPWQLYRKGKVDEALTELASTGWMEDIIGHILDSEFYGYTLLEIQDLNPREWTCGHLLAIERNYVLPERKLLLLEGSFHSAKVDYTEIMEPLGLLQFSVQGFGSLLECAYNVIWKYYARSDWSRASEKFGMPILAIKADTNNDAELDRIEARAATFGTDGYIVVQQGDDVEILERKGEKLYEIYLEKIKLCNEEVSKIINGQTSTSDQKAFTGSAEVHERVLEDFTLARMTHIQRAMNDQVLPFLAKKGFPVDGVKFYYPAVLEHKKKAIQGKTTDNDNEPTGSDK